MSAAQPPAAARAIPTDAPRTRATARATNPTRMGIPTNTSTKPVALLVIDLE